MPLDPHFDGWFHSTILHCWMLQKRLTPIFGGSSAERDQILADSEEAKFALEVSRELTRYRNI